MILLAGATEVPQTRPAQPRRTRPRKAPQRVQKGGVCSWWPQSLPRHPVPGARCSRAALPDCPGTIQWEAAANPLAVLLFPSFKDGRLPRPSLTPAAPSLPCDAGDGSEPQSGKMKVILGKKEITKFNGGVAALMAISPLGVFTSPSPAPAQHWGGKGRCGHGSCSTPRPVYTK